MIRRTREYFHGRRRFCESSKKMTSLSVLSLSPPLLLLSAYLFMLGFVAMSATAGEINADIFAAPSSSPSPSPSLRSSSLEHVNKFEKHSHYGDPKAGCLADEHNVTISGVAGDLCAPICHPNASVPCPTDLPAGVTAQPKCELTFSSGGGKGCVLICSPLSGGDSQCGTGTCQPIQGTGVCTYGAPPPPPPSGLPSGCVATTTTSTIITTGTLLSSGKGGKKSAFATTKETKSAEFGGMTKKTNKVSCTGNAAPGGAACDKLFQVCCMDELNNTFAALQRYSKISPFDELSIGCSGRFDGGDAAWSTRFGELLADLTPSLRSLSLDLSFNQVGAQDNILSAIAPGLVANPGLSELILNLAAANVSDAGAKRLGSLLQQHFTKGTTLAVNLGFSDPSDLPHSPKPLSAVGAENFATAVATISSLRNLSLYFHFDMGMGAHGMARVAVGLEPLSDKLEFLRLYYGYTDNKDPVPGGNPPDFACLGRALGSFTRLKRLDLNLDGDVSDPECVRALGLHLSCLPLNALLPMFNDNADCHCGLKVDTDKKCLVPNQYYSGDLGKGCFTCSPQANQTACK